jgi:transposase
MSVASTKTAYSFRPFASTQKLSDVRTSSSEKPAWPLELEKKSRTSAESAKQNTYLRQPISIKKKLSVANQFLEICKEASEKQTLMSAHRRNMSRKGMRQGTSCAFPKKSQNIKF